MDQENGQARPQLMRPLPLWDDNKVPTCNPLCSFYELAETDGATPHIMYVLCNLDDEVVERECKPTTRALYAVAEAAVLLTDILDRFYETDAEQGPRRMQWFNIMGHECVTREKLAEYARSIIGDHDGECDGYSPASLPDVSG